MMLQTQQCGGRSLSYKSCSSRSSFVARPFSTNTRQNLQVVRATADDDELEKRLAQLRKAKGATPFGEGTKSRKRDGAPGASPQQPANGSKEYDYRGEVLHYEGKPSTGDLVVNVVLGATLIWLPLTIAAVTHALYVTYRISDKRITVTTAAPWKTESTSVPFEEVKDVVAISRGLGLWGDMVVTLRNNDKVELRSLEQYKELREYIITRRDAVKKPEFFDPMAEGSAPTTSTPNRPGTKGFA